MGRSLVVLALTAGVGCQVPSQQKENGAAVWPQRDQVAAAARVAKSRGLSAVTYSGGPIPEYARADSLDQAIGGHLFAFLVEILGKRCTLSADGNTIESWYPARMVDDFGRTLPRGSDPTDIGPPPPSDLLPIGENSLLLVQGGGSVEMNGVVVTMPETTGAFRIGHKYLVFDGINHNKDGSLARVANPEFETASYSYDEQTDRFAPLSGDGLDGLTEDLMRRSGGSFRSLCLAIRSVAAAAPRSSREQRRAAQ